MHQAKACSPNGILVRSGMINTMRALQQRSGVYFQGVYFQGMCLQEGSRRPRLRFGGA